jgi:predicted esterase
MNARQRTALVLAITCVMSNGCRAPTLWIGTARSDAGLPLGAASTPLQGTPMDLPPGAESAVGQAVSAPSALTTANGSAGSLARGVDEPVAAPTTGLPSANTVAPPQATLMDAGMVDHGVAPTARMPRVPQPSGDCPTISGSGFYTFRGGGRSLGVQLTMAPRVASRVPSVGPLLLYFHSLGADASEVTKALGQNAIDEVVAQGGVVASFQDSPCLSCGLPEDVVWYDEDDPVTDQLVACAVAQALIDTRRIHVVGFSSGALHALHLLLARSDFVASVVSYSGGTLSTPPEPQDVTNKVPALLASGEAEKDLFAGVDFRTSSHQWSDTYGARGYYTLLCDHDGAHEIPTALVPHALRFLRDHPYRVEPEPYAQAVPSEFPSYCRSAPVH